MYSDAANPINIRQKGSILLDGKEIANTVQCCHCNRHYLFRKGSGKIRGYCIRCGQVTCGRKECDPCIPFEKKLEAIERKATFEFRLIA